MYFTFFGNKNTGKSQLIVRKNTNIFNNSQAPMHIYAIGGIFMGSKGLDFKHKEVINITDGRRLRLCARCKSRFRIRYHHIYNGSKIENRYSRFEFVREQVRKAYKTKKGENRTGYVVKEEYRYDVVCKVEM